ncbi:MAG: hypothetical protein LBM23_06650 [Propionibacteriaceae bacterium]|jgi:KDO2-lipid IV(A) lauroyltransferase|nr:hypothetical protein [Propionibacteriaceae bacterium]
MSDLDTRLLGAAFHWGPRLLGPAPVRHALGELASAIAVPLDPPALRQWTRNVTLATGVSPNAAATRTVVRAHVRTLTEAIVLPRWSHDEVRRRVTVDDRDLARLQRAHEGPGLILALPHMANWDLAGAWLCLNGIPLSTVAERLPDGLFETYRAMRSSLGFTVHSDDDPQALARLTNDLAGGKAIALVADRVLAGHGLDVTWPTATGRRLASAPPGPALLARRSGATLIGVGLHYTPTGIHVELSPDIPVVAGPTGLRDMAQNLIDFFAGQIAATPHDWLMFQRFFPEDRTHRRSGAARTSATAGTAGGAR